MKKFIRALTIVLSLTTALPAYAWRVSTPSIDQLRGTVDIRMGYGAEDSAAWLSVRCKNNVTTMYILNGGYVFPNHSKVIYKINDDPVRTNAARSSASYDSLFITNPIPMIRHMLNGGDRGSMIIEFELEYYENVQTTIRLYDPYGVSDTFAEAMKPIQKACNWE